MARCLLICSFIVIAAAMSCGGNPQPGGIGSNGDGNGDNPPGTPDTAYGDRVDVMFHAPAGKEWSDPNWFDIQRTPEEYQEYYAWAEGGYLSDPRVQEFLVAEYLKIIDQWELRPIVTVRLPAGMTASEAIATWPAKYPAVVLLVQALYY